jgi:hypothetical protein
MLDYYLCEQAFSNFKEEDKEMKKVIGIVLSMGLLVGLAGCSSAQTTAAPAASAPAAAELKVGRVDYAAHGTKAVATAFAVVQGDKIVKAYVDEYQFMDPAAYKAVPNSDKDFGTAGYKDATKAVLASKKLNAEKYSANMAKNAGSTIAWDKNIAAIEQFATGKTIAELEKLLKDTPKEKMPIDTISGSTLADSHGYLTSILEAAKVAK